MSPTSHPSPRPPRLAARLVALALGPFATACHTIELEPRFMESPPAVEHLRDMTAAVVVGDECLADRLSDWCDMHRFVVAGIQFWARESLDAALSAAFASLRVRQSADAAAADIVIYPAVSLEVSGIVSHEAVVQLTLVGKDRGGDVIASVTGTGRSASAVLMDAVESNIRAAFDAALEDAVRSLLPALDAWAVGHRELRRATQPGEAAGGTP